jgi:hypothetical protein
MLALVVPCCRRDVEQLTLLLQSLSKNITDWSCIGCLDLLIVEPPSEEAAFETVVQRLVPLVPCRTSILRLSALCPGVGRAAFHFPGWHLQQVAKIVYATRCDCEWFMVLGCQNALTRPVEPRNWLCLQLKSPTGADALAGEHALRSSSSSSELISTSARPVVHVEDLHWHNAWWCAAASALNHSGMLQQARVPSSGTPVFIHTASACAMVREVGGGDGCMALFHQSKRGMDCTDFTLYWTYMHRQYGGTSDIATIVEDFHDTERMIWNECEPVPDINRKLKTAARGDWTYIKAGAWAKLSDEQKLAFAQSCGAGLVVDVAQKKDASGLV